MGYFDTLNLARQIQCPVLVGMGMQDEVCPAGTIFAVYNRLRAEKTLIVYPDAGHWVPGKHEELKFEWIMSQLEQQRN